MAKKQKPNTKKTNKKANKKGGSVFQKITAVIAAIILIPTIALAGLILYAGASGNTIEVPAPLMSVLEQLTVSDNSVSDNGISGNTATGEGNVLNVAGISNNGSGSNNGKTQKINLIYDDVKPAAPVKEAEKKPEETQSEQTISENIADRKVWVTPEGLKYHTKANCGDSDSTDAGEVTFLYALDEGYKSCETCYPDGNTESEEAVYSDR